MTKRFDTFGGVLKWDHITEQVFQTRCLNPPTHNARFKDRIKRDYPDYTFVEQWKD